MKKNFLLIGAICVIVIITLNLMGCSSAKTSQTTNTTTDLTTTMTTTQPLVP